jgi:hypothetical protein
MYGICGDTKLKLILCRTPLVGKTVRIELAEEVGSVSGKPVLWIRSDFFRSVSGSRPSCSVGFGYDPVWDPEFFLKSLT